MLKKTLSIALFCSSIIASAQSSHTDQTTTPQSLSESVALIIEDLERGIDLLNNISIAKKHLDNVFNITTQEIVKLIALIRIGKIKDQELILLVNKLILTFRTYQEKLSAEHGGIKNITPRNNHDLNVNENLDTI